LTPTNKPLIAKLAIDKPIICFVTNRASLPVITGVSREEVLLERIRGAAAAGVDWIELREKDLDSRPLLELTRAAVTAVRSSVPSGVGSSGDGSNKGPRLLLNDRLDVACVTGADGVHLTETSLPVGTVVSWTRQCGRKLLVGASCHSPEGALQADADGADYIFFGPVFATPSKAAFGPPQGLAKLGEICHAVKIPVLAIGGITMENAAACVEAGAAGIAAIGLFQQSNDLAGLLTELRKRLS
jgi:thiamine-phosphate pyrophosphorylase